MWGIGKAIDLMLKDSNSDFVMIFDYDIKVHNAAGFEFY